MLKRLLLIAMLGVSTASTAQVFGDVLNMVQRQGFLKRNRVKKINVFYHLSSEKSTSRYLLNTIELTADGYVLSNYTICSYISPDRSIRHIMRRADGKIMVDYITPLTGERADTLFLQLFTYDQAGRLSKAYDLQYGRLARVTYDTLGRLSGTCTYSFIKPSPHYKPGQRFYGDFSYKSAVMKINSSHLAAGRQQIDSLMAYPWSYKVHGLENVIEKFETRIAVSYHPNKLPDDLLVKETDLQTNENRVAGYYTFEYEYFK